MFGEDNGQIDAWLFRRMPPPFRQWANGFVAGRLDPRDGVC
jgi:hypothetical protein